MKPKITSIVGARPQFIKLAPLAKMLAPRVHHRIIHTGQHFDENMSDIFFGQLHLPRPEVNLHTGGGTHGNMTGRILSRIEKVLIRERPDFVLVYGDTNSTLAGALAAAKLAIPVGHVEAGMRSFVSDMPEEINRKLTDHVSEILFCPTPTAVRNARKEGIKKQIVHAGDVMFELLDGSKKLVRANRQLLERFSLPTRGYLLLTVHRAGTVDIDTNMSRLIEILQVLPLPTLFPIHPRTRNRLRRFGLLSKLHRIEHLVVTEPMGYADILTAAAHAQAVLTDSGGLQKEALFLGTPVLTLRDETEWVETLRSGNHLVGLNRARILRLLNLKLTVKPISYRIDGRKPSQIIAAELIRYFEK